MYKKVTRYVHHVVNSSSYPIVSVLVSVATVTGHVATGKLGKVDLLEPIVVIVHCSHDTWPRLLEYLRKKVALQKLKCKLTYNKYQLQVYTEI